MQFGTTEKTPDHILDKLIQFTFHVYGSSKLTKINKLRNAKFQERYSATSLPYVMDAYTGMDMSLLPHHAPEKRQLSDTGLAFSCPGIARPSWNSWTWLGVLRRHAADKMDKRVLYAIRLID
jgi:hypothetical protein